MHRLILKSAVLAPSVVLRPTRVIHDCTESQNYTDAYTPHLSVSRPVCGLAPVTAERRVLSGGGGQRPGSGAYQVGRAAGVAA
jgi:hypothetical protein